MQNLFKKIKLFYTKEELKNLESQTIIKEDSNEKKLITVKESHIIEIHIKECSFKDFYNDKSIDKFNISMRHFISDGILSPDTILKEQRIYIIEKENKKYYITLSESQLMISEYSKIGENIYETELEVNYSKNKFKISKYVHDLNYSTGGHKSYPCDSEMLKEYFSLDKQEAFSLVNNLLNNLQKTDGIDDIIDCYEIYKILNIIPKEFYNPVISDEKISLSWICTDKNDNINKQEFVLFDIVLNDTKEVIGNITFDYDHTGFSYYGNVSYEIKYEFRNNHYATRALSLLKQVLKNNEFSGDKDLYISTVPENIKSQKVIQNNNGNLVYEGPVPEYESIHYIDGVKEVKVYRIDMNKRAGK